MHQRGTFIGVLVSKLPDTGRYRIVSFQVPPHVEDGRINEGLSSLHPDYSALVQACNVECSWFGLRRGSPPPASYITGQ